MNKWDVLRNVVKAILYPFAFVFTVILCVGGAMAFIGCYLLCVLTDFISSIDKPITQIIPVEVKKNEERQETK